MQYSYSPIRMYLHAGEFHCAMTPTLVSTVLGSCVSVCLWDPVLGLGGLNHFMLPISTPREGGLRFGDDATDALIAGMRALGCRNLVAKVFGGAAVLRLGPGHQTIGEQNARAALHRLELLDIPIVSCHLGGERGVAIRLDTGTGEVILRRIAAVSVQRHG